MAIDLQQLMALDFPERVFSYTERDTMLYALSVGLGRHLPEELGFVYERQLQALPTQATVIGWDDTWQEHTGMDIRQIVHGEQRVTLHQPLHPAGQVRAKLKVKQVFDKGPGRGAVVLAETRLHDAVTGELMATLLSTVFARGDGGFGGPPGRGPLPHQVPDRAPDGMVVLATRPEQALLYRLSGDRNPLHVDAGFAQAAGFERPILHGLCTYGMACASVVKWACAGQAKRMTHFEARFTAPVYPGDTLVTSLWLNAGVVSFRTRVAEGDRVVLDHGQALLETA